MASTCNLNLLEREEVCIKAFQKLDKVCVSVGLIVCRGGGGGRRQGASRPSRSWTSWACVFGCNAVLYLWLVGRCDKY